MSLDIYFSEDVAARLLALAQSNERTLQLAADLGANPRGIALVRAAYQGALCDVGVSFGLARTELVVIMKRGSDQTRVPILETELTQGKREKRNDKARVEPAVDDPRAVTG